jgi:hypothetical protein
MQTNPPARSGTFAVAPTPAPPRRPTAPAPGPAVDRPADLTVDSPEDPATAAPVEARERGGRGYAEEQLGRIVARYLGLTLAEFEERARAGDYQEAPPPVRALTAWLDELRAPKAAVLPTLPEDGPRDHVPVVDGRADRI